MLHPPVSTTGPCQDQSSAAGRGGRGGEHGAGGAGCGEPGQCQRSLERSDAKHGQNRWMKYVPHF